MLKRLLLGMVIGLVVGGGVAGVTVEALHLTSFAEQTAGTVLAYALASVTGVLVGLIAGKPIWAREAKIEAGLKAFFGALLGAGLMFAVRTWLGLQVDLGVLHAGAGVVGDLPAASLPLIAVVLGTLYELDNTPGDEKKPAAKRAPAPAKGARVAPAADDEEDEAAEAPKQAKR